MILRSKTLGASVRRIATSLLASVALTPLGGCATSPAPVASVAAAMPLVLTVRDRFYDRERAAAWAERHAALDERDHEAVRRALAELGASHTEFVPLGDPRHAQLRAIFGPERDRVTAPSIGAEIVQVEGGWFLRQVRSGGPAAALGLLRGDEVLLADGMPFDARASLEGRDAVTLTLRRSPGEAPFVRTVPIERWSIRAEWAAVQAAGTAVVERGGRRIGVVTLTSGAGEAYLQAMEESLRGPLRSCDALVVDLRDGVGGCSPDYVRPFLTEVPVLRTRTRDGAVSIVDSQWRAPVVLLVNRGTRSGKEVIARSLQRHGRATLVGERTAGAVLGGSLFPLRSGDLLYLAVLDVEVDGERLEGVGVAPDVAVEDRLPHAAGRDPQRDAAIDVAVSLVVRPIAAP